MGEVSDFDGRNITAQMPRSAESDADREIDEDPFIAIDDPNCEFSEDVVRVKEYGGFLVQIGVVDIGEIDPQNKDLQRAIDLKKTRRPGKRKNTKNSVLGRNTAKKLRFEDRPKGAIVLSQRFDSDIRFEGASEIVTDVIKVSRPLYQGNVGLFATVDDLPAGIENITKFYNKLREKRFYRNRPVLDAIPKNTYAAEIYTTLANGLAAAWSRSNGVPVIYHGVNYDDIDYKRLYNTSRLPRAYSHKISHNQKAIRLFPELNDGYSPITSPFKDVVDAINLIQIRHALAGNEPPFDEQFIKEAADHLSQS